jgi:ABC-type branched-subunit amino acid transport system permease subunit
MTPLANRRELAWGAGILLALAALALLPLATRRDDVLNFVFLILLSITLAESWNMLAGYVGQVNLGHAAFFGLGALVARTLWSLGTPILLAMVAGAAAAAVFALPIGAAAFRLRGAYFAVGTLALGEILRTTVANVLPEISTLPTGDIGTYRLSHRYYLALALASLSVILAGLLGACERSAKMRTPPRPPAWARSGSSSSPSCSRRGWPGWREGSSLSITSATTLRMPSVPPGPSTRFS